MSLRPRQRTSPLVPEQTLEGLGWLAETLAALAFPTNLPGKADRMSSIWLRVRDWFVRLWCDFEGWREDRLRRR
jgi:hypothetical protein